MPRPEAYVADALNDRDHGDAEEERHQAANLGHELLKIVLILLHVWEKNYMHSLSNIRVNDDIFL